MDIRANYLHTIEMRNPDWIPISVFWPRATWQKYGSELREITIKHPSLFSKSLERVDLRGHSARRKGGIYTDEWGCVWHNLRGGLAGQVVKHPLEDWNAFETFKPPDLLSLGGPTQTGSPPDESWEDVYRRLQRNKNEGRPLVGNCPHDFLFQRLYDLRGFKNFLLDTIRRPPHFLELIDIIAEANLELIRRWVEIGVDVIAIGDDMGTQNHFTINPKAFRELIIPAYSRMLRVIREAGIHVYLHSDGHILEVVEDLVNAGVDILNLQSRANGIDNTAKMCKGKVCVDIDVDRQLVMPFGTHEEIEEHVKEIVAKVGSREGGLMIKADVYPDTPLGNIEYLCTSLEKYQGYYSDNRP